MHVHKTLAGLHGHKRTFTRSSSLTILLTITTVYVSVSDQWGRWVESYWEGPSGRAWPLYRKERHKPLCGDRPRGRAVLFGNFPLCHLFQTHTMCSVTTNIWRVEQHIKIHNFTLNEYFLAKINSLREQRNLCKPIGHRRPGTKGPQESSNAFVTLGVIR